MRRSVRMMRTAISPRFATRTVWNMASPEISTRIGVGSKPLQGLLICGQFEMTQSTSISASNSTWSPGAEMPSSIVIAPLGLIGTFMKKLMLGTMSRLVMPWRDSSRMKFSRQA